MSRKLNHLPLPVIYIRILKHLQTPKCLHELSTLTKMRPETIAKLLRVWIAEGAVKVAYTKNINNVGRNTYFYVLTLKGISREIKPPKGDFTVDYTRVPSVFDFQLSHK